MSTTTSAATSAIANTAAAKSGTTATANDDSEKSTIDYESFLKLLTAQLKNQDPLAPMDATQFMTQLAQLSTVEQTMKTNDTMGQVLDTLKTSGMRLDMAYVGRTVEAESDGIALQNGSAQMAYTVDGTPASVKIEVQNSAGNTVYSTAGSLATGRQTFTWNGKTTGGGTAADGVYKIKITAKDKDGTALDTATVITDTVKEVRNVDGASQFVLKSGVTVPSDAILSAS